VAGVIAGTKTADASGAINPVSLHPPSPLRAGITSCSRSAAPAERSPRDAVDLAAPAGDVRDRIRSRVHVRRRGLRPRRDRPGVVPRGSIQATASPSGSVNIPSRPCLSRTRAASFPSRRRRPRCRSCST
jgi:hypothetical protein